MRGLLGLSEVTWGDVSLSKLTRISRSTGDEHGITDRNE